MKRFSFLGLVLAAASGVVAFVVSDSNAKNKNLQPAMNGQVIVHANGFQDCTLVNVDPTCFTSGVEATGTSDAGTSLI